MAPSPGIQHIAESTGVGTDTEDMWELSSFKTRSLRNASARPSCDAARWGGFSGDVVCILKLKSAEQRRRGVAAEPARDSFPLACVSASTDRSWTQSTVGDPTSCHSKLPSHVL